MKCLHDDLHFPTHPSTNCSWLHYANNQANTSHVGLQQHLPNKRSKDLQRTFVFKFWNAFHFYCLHSKTCLDRPLPWETPVLKDHSFAVESLDFVQCCMSIQSPETNCLQWLNFVSQSGVFQDKFHPQIILCLLYCLGLLATFSVRKCEILLSNWHNTQKWGSHIGRAVLPSWNRDSVCRRSSSGTRQHILSQVQWNLSWETTGMRDHLSWWTTYYWQKVPFFSAIEPVTKDHLSWDTIYLWPMGWRFYCIIPSTPSRNISEILSATYARKQLVSYIMYVAHTKLQYTYCISFRMNI